MPVHSFAKGDKVAIINSTLGGRFMVESHGAIVVKPIKHSDEYYTVKIVNRHGETETVDRFIDTSAQADPQAFVDRLNAKRL